MLLVKPPNGHATMPRFTFRLTSRWLLLFCLIAPSADARDVVAPSQLAATTKPALMLANVYTEGVDLSAYWVSEKLDGVRAYWDGQSLISRGGYPIQAPDWFTAGFPKVPLDGELWMGRGTFERLSGTVRRLDPDPDQWRNVRFMVFDLPGSDAPFGQRLQMLKRVIADSVNHSLAPVEQFRVADHAELMTRLDAIVQAGGEGLMLHRDGADYRAGRTDDLLKVKPYLDAEATVIEHLPGQGKFAGMLGALLVEDATGRRFRLGTGLTDAERRKPPPIGSVVTFKYLGETEKGLPRFASFLRVRVPE
jgi:DNA ligase-1